MRVLLATAAFLAPAFTASALTFTPIAADCDPSVVAAFPDPTTCGLTADRTDSSAVNSGDPDGAFYSLGLDTAGGLIGGALVLEVDPAFSGSGAVFEVTNPSNHKEAAEVYVGTFFNDAADNDLTLAGLVDNGAGGAVVATTSITFDAGTTYSYIALLDVSRDVYSDTGTTDGFDVDSIKLTPVPVPASALLLGAALAGLGAIRRKA